MSREQIDTRPTPWGGPDTRDRRWVMRCDVNATGPTPRCPTQSDPSNDPPPLQTFIDAGWYIAAFDGDICPTCLTAGIRPWNPAHSLMPAAVVALYNLTARTAPTSTVTTA